MKFRTFSLLRLVPGGVAALLVGVSAVAAQPVLRESAMLFPEYYEQDEAHLGQAMVAADFDGDGYDDLAVGAPDYDDDIRPDAGLVAIYRGSPQGLRLWTVLRGDKAGDHFGTALAAADVDGIGHENWLAIGAPGADITSTTLDGGAVFIYEYRAVGGWTYDTTWYQGFDFVTGGHWAGAAFGSTIIALDRNGDGRDDFAVGAPERNVRLLSGTVLNRAGSVNYFLSNVSRPQGSPRLSVFKTEIDLGVAEQAGARFGTALAAADFDGDGADDVVIGAPDADVDGQSGAGRVHIDYSIGTDQVIDDGDVAGGVEAGDRFGAAVAAGDFNFGLACLFITCRPDLAVGVPGENGGGGRVTVVYSGAGGPDPSQRLSLFQQNASALSSAEAGDGFGAVLHAAEVNRLLGIDLLIGAPTEDWSSTIDQGIAHVTFGGDSSIGSYSPVDLVAIAGITRELGAANDFLGSSVATGDFDGSGSTDVAVGIPGRTVVDITTGGIILRGLSGPPIERPGSGAVIVFSDALFADGFESGNLSAWSASSP